MKIVIAAANESFGGDTCIDPMGSGFASQDGASCAQEAAGAGISKVCIVSSSCIL